MNIKNLFPSAYLRASDVETPRLVTIQALERDRKMNSGELKHVLSFVECDQELVLNKTNCNSIAQMYGDETDNWIGKQIVLIQSTTDMQGQTKDCIRIRAPKQKPAVAPVKPAPAKPAPAQPDDNQDDVPF